MSTKFDDTQSEHRRDDDKMRVDHVIPLPWLLGLVGAILVWAAVQHFGLQAANESVKTANESVKALTVQVKQLSEDIGARNLRDVERDFKLADVMRRVQELETRDRKK